MTAKTTKPLSWYREVYIKDGYRCVYCGRDMLSDFDTWMSIEIDHLVPQSKGGDDSLDNCVASCNVCNKLKATFLPDGYSEMSPADILSVARANVLMKRSEWQARLYPAIEEFRHNQNMRLGSNP